VIVTRNRCVCDLFDRQKSALDPCKDFFFFWSVDFHHGTYLDVVYWCNSGVHNKLFASWTRLSFFLNQEILSFILAWNWVQNCNSGTSEASWAQGAFESQFLQEALRVPECKSRLKLHKILPWSRKKLALKYPPHQSLLWTLLMRLELVFFYNKSSSYSIAFIVSVYCKKLVQNSHNLLPSPLLSVTVSLYGLWLMQSIISKHDNHRCGHNLVKSQKSFISAVGRYTKGPFGVSSSFFFV
jgi:hypothetical protein